MALIKCKECGKEMSDKAKICPHCGLEQNKKKRVIITSIIIIILIAIILIIFMKGTNNFKMFGVSVEDYFGTWELVGNEEIVTNEDVSYKLPKTISLNKDNISEVLHYPLDNYQIFEKILYVPMNFKAICFKNKKNKLVQSTCPVGNNSANITENYNVEYKKVESK